MKNVLSATSPSTNPDALMDSVTSPRSPSELSAVVSCAFIAAS